MYNTKCPAGTTGIPNCHSDCKFFDYSTCSKTTSSTPAQAPKPTPPSVPPSNSVEETANLIMHQSALTAKCAYIHDVIENPHAFDSGLNPVFGCKVPIAGVGACPVGYIFVDGATRVYDKSAKREVPAQFVHDQKDLYNDVEIVNINLDWLNDIKKMDSEFDYGTDDSIILWNLCVERLIEMPSGITTMPIKLK